jgi:hypothetical protein
MKQTPQLFSADWLIHEAGSVSVGFEDGKWFAARPQSLGSLLTRFRLAWGVFIGKYDALKWERQ